MQHAATHPTAALRRTRPASGAPHLARWAGAGTLAAPLTIVVHELGHWGARVALGFPEPRLHYASVSDGYGEGEAPVAEGAIAAAAGPVVTLVLLAGACALVARRGPRPLAVAVAFAAPIRFLVGLTYLAISAYVALRGGRMGAGDFDEYYVASAAGIPVAVLVGIEVAVTAAAWRSVGRALPAGRRWAVIAATAAGVAAGVVLWTVLLGPRLLP